jgi:hypothetical protein
VILTAQQRKSCTPELSEEHQMLPVFLNPKKECDPKVMSLAVLGGFMFSVFNHLNGLSPVTK